jgi:hypothetical protein
VDQKRLTQFIPRQRDLFIARIEAFCPKITRGTGFTELRVGNRNCGVAKLGIDRAHHGGLRWTPNVGQPEPLPKV